ncbi:hypothetical protein NP493_405g01000 [Ridgeia piscesae]|uniref:DDE Tnp4 domain-containing protein n=1 Tax=Ridgeia piscesae TaxID=27915 RepID=A0AAD9NSX2_RIDPI|nr:hypothetical protein NP493_405g01000 [Ridgeia piscesae]
MRQHWLICSSFQETLEASVTVVSRSRRTHEPSGRREEVPTCAHRSMSSALVARMQEWVQLPTQQQADRQKAKFLRLAGFPNVVGCIDGTHVRIQAPPTNEHEYVNRKNFHSINVQVICDADLRIVNCIVKWPGSVHDSRILRESELFTAFESPRKPVTGVFLGDSGYTGCSHRFSTRGIGRNGRTRMLTVSHEARSKDASGS